MIWSGFPSLADLSFLISISRLGTIEWITLFPMVIKAGTNCVHNARNLCSRGSQSVVHGLLTSCTVLGKNCFCFLGSGDICWGEKVITPRCQLYSVLFSPLGGRQHFLCLPLRGKEEL